ncbi:hypothetical protein QQY24_21865 [Streptomyces sp. TG1A-8]|uniref:hypothetical protein n=1 Tax=Streptomyces sp. TG1A-8 TaxID=3051385 RepID=UPI00265C5BFC|nr:hypothetical protein [Streptomyces sp. TG1A-8]MDO0927922.1 hypothetical protein [Streptomyces sp. TG1A-8]
MSTDRSPKSRRPGGSPKRFLDRLVRDTVRTLTPPTGPEAFLHAVCATLSPQLDRPVRLKFVGFPPGLDVSGVTFAMDEEYVVVVEERAPDAHKFVITGHELGHIHYQTLDVHYPAGMPTAARRLLSRDDGAVPWDQVVAMATRSPAAAAADAEWEAEECGLRLAAKFSKVVGPHAAAGRTTQDTLTGRLSSSLGNIGGP